VSARIQQEKQLAALEAHQAEMQRKRDSPQHRDIHRNSSPGQPKSADQVKCTAEDKIRGYGVHIELHIYCINFQEDISIFNVYYLGVMNLLVLTLPSKIFCILPFPLLYFACSSTLNSSNRRFA
jgi:hypothetical protein